MWALCKLADDTTLRGPVDSSRVGLSFRRDLGWTKGTGQQEPHEIEQLHMQSSVPVMEQPQVLVQAENWLGK